MRSIIVVEVLPRLELCIQINIVRVCQQWIELRLIRSMGTFDFTVQLWCLSLDVRMPHPLLFDMAVETGLYVVKTVETEKQRTTV